MREELAEARKENRFLHKQRHSSQRESSRGISIHRRTSGSIWCLLRRLKIYPNAYYNYRKHRRAKETARKRNILRQIQTIYHKTNGVAGYRRMRIYLAHKGIKLSALTVHKYMNTELGGGLHCATKTPRCQGLLIPHTTMHDRILIVDTVRHSKRGIQHKFIGHSCYKNA